MKTVLATLGGLGVINRVAISIIRANPEWHANAIDRLEASLAREKTLYDAGQARRMAADR